MPKKILGGTFSSSRTQITEDEYLSDEKILNDSEIQLPCADIHQVLSSWFTSRIIDVLLKDTELFDKKYIKLIYNRIMTWNLLTLRQSNDLRIFLTGFSSNKEKLQRILDLLLSSKKIDENCRWLLDSSWNILSSNDIINEVLSYLEKNDLYWLDYDEIWISDENWFIKVVKDGKSWIVKINWDKSEILIPCILDSYEIRNWLLFSKFWDKYWLFQIVNWWLVSILEPIYDNISYDVFVGFIKMKINGKTWIMCKDWNWNFVLFMEPIYEDIWTINEHDSLWVIRDGDKEWLFRILPDGWYKILCEPKYWRINIFILWHKNFCIVEEYPLNWIIQVLEDEIKEIVPIRYSRISFPYLIWDNIFIEIEKESKAFSWLWMINKDWEFDELVSPDLQIYWKISFRNDKLIEHKTLDWKIWLWEIVWGKLIERLSAEYGEVWLLDKDWVAEVWDSIKYSSRKWFVKRNEDWSIKCLIPPVYSESSRYLWKWLFVLSNFGENTYWLYQLKNWKLVEILPIKYSYMYGFNEDGFLEYSDKDGKWLLKRVWDDIRVLIKPKNNLQIFEKDWKKYVQYVWMFGRKIIKSLDSL